MADTKPSASVSDDAPPAPLVQGLDFAAILQAANERAGIGANYLKSDETNAIYRRGLPLYVHAAALDNNITYGERAQFFLHPDPTAPKDEWKILTLSITNLDGKRNGGRVELVNGIAAALAESKRRGGASFIGPVWLEKVPTKAGQSAWNLTPIAPDVQHRLVPDASDDDLPFWTCKVYPGRDAS